jgi:hypothetical protein
MNFVRFTVYVLRNPVDIGENRPVTGDNMIILFLYAFFKSRKEIQKKYTKILLFRYQGTIRTDYFLVSSSTDTCFKIYNFILEFLIRVQSFKQQNASNPQLLERTACIIICAQAVLFSDKPVSNKCANHTFYVRRKVWGLPKG